MSGIEGMNRAGHEYPSHPTDRRRRVYFIRPVGMDGPIKIGCSLHPRARMSTFSTWSPWPLELVAEIVGDIELEHNIQDCFADSWSHREWFNASPRLLKFIDDIRAGTPVHEAVDLSVRVANARGLKRKQVQERRGTPMETYSL